MSILKNIDRYCKEQNITIKEFERRCGISNSLVNKWRTGVAKPSLSTLAKIVSTTGIELGEWFKEGDEHDCSRQDSGAIC